MKKLNYMIVGLVVAVGLAGCTASWVSVDKTPVNDTKLNTALQKCQFEKRRKKANKYLAAVNGISKSLDEEMERLHKETYDKALECMRKEGFARE